MGKKAELKAQLAQTQRECAGLRARATGQPYHSDSREERLVYHNRRTCSEGLKIEPVHLFAGTGDHPNPCQVCQTIPATK